MNKRHRIFIAINLPNDIKKQLAGFEQKWPDVPAKWTPQDNLHITLVFLGDLTDEELAEVCLATKEASERHNTFNIYLNKVAYGPENKIPPRYIWAGGEASKELSLLKKYLENNFLEKIINFKPEPKAFSPHITLARISALAGRAIEPEERPDVGETVDL